MTVKYYLVSLLAVRLYRKQLEHAQSTSAQLGVGVAVFQALSNLAINGVVFAVVSHGGLLLATDRISPGNLMAFLVATQTIQRSAMQAASTIRDH